jgi:hypothetical protein
MKSYCLTVCWCSLSQHLGNSTDLTILPSVCMHEWAPRHSRTRSYRLAFCLSVGSMGSAVQLGINYNVLFPSQSCRNSINVHLCRLIGFSISRCLGTTCDRLRKATQSVGVRGANCTSANASCYCHCRDVAPEFLKRIHSSEARSLFMSRG